MNEENFNEKKEAGNLSEKPSLLNKRILLLILFFILFSFIFSSSLYSFTKVKTVQEISEEQLSQGKEIRLQEGEKIYFQLINDSHTLKINSVSDNKIEITIQSRIIKSNFTVGEEKSFDIDEDGIYELSVRLIDIKNRKPNIHIKKIKEIKENTISKRINENKEVEKPELSNDLDNSSESTINSINDISPGELIYSNNIDEEWNIIEAIKTATKERNQEKVNLYLYNKINFTECIGFFGLEGCWNLFDINYNRLSKENFIFKDTDSIQSYIMSKTERNESAEWIEYKKLVISFIREPAKKYLILLASTSLINGHTKTGTSLSIQEIEKILNTSLIDSDRDGLTDEIENCLGAKAYDQNCKSTNSLNKDSDGDGWWDSIEVWAETNPLDKNRIPIFLEDTSSNSYIPKITIKNCSESWYCETWSICDNNGMKTRKCYDSSQDQCSNISNKPVEIQPCVKEDVYQCQENGKEIRASKNGINTTYQDTCTDLYSYTDYYCLSNIQAKFWGSIVGTVFNTQCEKGKICSNGACITTYPNTGILNITSNLLGAKVILDYKEAGTTPLLLTNINIGNYFVEVYMNGCASLTGRFYTVNANETRDIYSPIINCQQ